VQRRVECARLMSHTISIRPLEPGDVPELCHLAGHIWRAHYVPDIVSAEQIEFMLPKVASPQAIEKNLREKNQRFWVAENNGALTGYVAVEPRGNGHWFLDKLYVEVSGHRNGLGSLMLAHAARETSATTLSLRVNRKNYKAINFYFKHGFSITALDVLSLSDGFVMDDFLMRRDYDTQ
jgi:diamine N-acetyltransferase